ncbi:major facilitator superfamily protein [Sphingobium sp. SYK-6]|uniref:peptide MFS transporter n=1 Tax=Sphingobium sp. (strain NBRC 103272 / SYK-6) TaxID=627192 RepID=UPI00022773BC|nr:peptide MFS transporter [Sphingobium sp. SYK-6]BAK66015.1 major facilitator superfamily protein [Sphingobium sp. SYK-6]
MTTAEATPSLTMIDHADRAFLGHPKGLAYLAFAEAWERFSYYGMQTLLVLYMVKYLLLPGQIENVWMLDAFRQLPLYRGLDGQPLASAIFGTYAASVYLTPILGGFLADRFLGKRRTVLLGAITMAIGHFLMAFEASFLLALLCMVLGAGMFKGNIASQVGALYKPDDLRRADAFQIFYLGINAGVIGAPLIVGALGEKVGWHWGFGAAGVGMLIGLAIYVSGQKYLPSEQFEPRSRAGAIAASPRPPMSRQDWLALIAVLLLIPVMAIAIVPNNQIFNAYLIWGDQTFDLDFFGTRLPTSFLVTLDAIVSVSFLAIVALFWRWYGRHWQEPDELSKMVIGSLFSTGGMLCLFMAASTDGSDGRIGLLWPVLFHVVNSIGFANLLPVSLALFARLAPKALNATVIGLYYLAFFGGNSLVGWVGGYYETMATPVFWLMHAGFAASAGGIFLIFKLLLSKRLMHAPLPVDA